MYVASAQAGQEIRRRDLAGPDRPLQAVPGRLGALRADPETGLVAYWQRIGVRLTRRPVALQGSDAVWFDDARW